jgi:CRP-like cAMP-binding protein
MYLVLEGLLYTSGGRAVAHRPSLPSILRPGDLFDAFATLLGNVHTTTVKTRTPSLICEISIAGLQELFNSNPNTLNQVAKNLMELDTKSGMIWDEERFMAMTAQMHHLFPPATVSSKTLQ